MKTKVYFKRLSENAVLPRYETSGATGFDFSSAEEVIIEPHTTALIKTDLAIELPIGYELQVRCRSGIALKTPLFLKNGIGSVDQDYKGNIGIILHNLSDKPFTIEKGMRIAQGVIAKADQVEILETETLSESERGTKGFGSTGV